MSFKENINNNKLINHCKLKRRLITSSLLLKTISLVIAILVSIQHLKISETVNSSRAQNSEHMTMSLGDFEEDSFDDLEIIPESKDHAVINQKLERLHDFIKNYKEIKHPWEKLFIKNTEYQKSEKMYRKMMHDAIKRIRNLNRKGENENSLKFLKLIKQPYIGKRQLPKIKDKYDDSDDDDEEEDNQFAITESKPGEMKEEYEKELIKEREEGQLFNYSEAEIQPELFLGKPEETVMDALRKIIDIKTPTNCSNVTGFGITSVECLAKNYRQHEMTSKEAFKALMNILFIWMLIYLSIAIPLWCVKGWGCCCITWKYCNPKKMVEDVKRYIAENPPGVYVNEEGIEEHYAPSSKEKELYESINKKILSM